MGQLTFSSAGFDKFHKTTKKEIFLARMNDIIPWVELTKLIEPFYPKPEGPGRRPISLEKKLKIYFLQHWFQLSDPAAEEAIYDSLAFREFIQIDLGLEAAPDETTILKFRHLMEKNELGAKVFELISDYLVKSGIKIEKGTIVDATIISAPTSIKNADGERDPEMKSTKKGSNWHFGMKVHIGMDSKSKIIHSVVVTAASDHDSTALKDLLHGDETRVYGDSAYTGKEEVIKETAPNAKDFTNRKGFRNKSLSEKEREKNKKKSSIRAKVEHAFFILKRQFGFQKVRYRGIEKNANHVFVSCALVNLVMAARNQNIKFA